MEEFARELEFDDEEVERMKNQSLSTELPLQDWMDMFKSQAIEFAIEHKKMNIAYNQSVEKSAEPPLKHWNNAIVCGDSLKILQKLPDESIDLIVTSPPYNIGMEYDKYNDKKEWSNYFSFLRAVWKECYRTLRKGGRICINIRPAILELTPTHYTIGNQLIETGFKWFHEIIWDKNYSRKKSDGWDYWQRTRTPFFNVSWEYIQIFFKEPLKKEGKTANIDVTIEEFRKWINAKWRIDPEFKMKSYGHPAMFPEEIPKRLIKLLSNPDDIVLDPFCGAGTTPLAAYNSNRRYIGVDMSEKYCNTAMERLKMAEREKWRRR